MQVVFQLLRCVALLSVFALGIDVAIIGVAWAGDIRFAQSGGGFTPDITDAPSDSAGLATRQIQSGAASRRVALVIGNSDYEHVSRLPNPSNDASDISSAFRRLGFSVTTALNLDYRGMRTALRDFARSAAGAEMAAIFYAGHGIEIERQNYLIPVDAELKTDRDVSFEAINLDQLMASVADAKGLKLVLLDACRNNPFASRMRMTRSTRSIGRGLSRVEPPSGILVGYAAKEGTTADDGDGRNSPYTKALLKYLEQPGLEIGKLFRRVRDNVLASTGGRQEPFTYGSLPGEDIYFVDPIKANQAAMSPGKVPDTQSTDMIVNDFKLANQIGSIRAWDTFVKRYENRSNSFLVELARDSRKTLEAKETQTAALNLDTDPDPSPTLAAPPEPPPPETEPEKPTLSQREITLRIQWNLQRLGCNPGTHDGIWGRKSRAALGQFAKYAKVTVTRREPTQEVLSLLRPRRGRVCPWDCGSGFRRLNGVCVTKISIWRAK